MNEEEPKKEKVKFELREDLQTKHILMFVGYVAALVVLLYLLYRFVI